MPPPRSSSMAERTAQRVISQSEADERVGRDIGWVEALCQRLPWATAARWSFTFGKDGDTLHQSECSSMSVRHRSSGKMVMPNAFACSRFVPAPEPAMT